MKVFVAALSTETNTFASTPTGLAAFSIERPPVGSGGPLADRALELAAEGGDAVVFGPSAAAAPGGVVVRAAYEALRDEILAALEAALPVDAVVLALHGAMVADGYDDCEGDLIAGVRRRVGPGCAIGVELDLHCHFTEQMRREADIVIAYKEYPHTDVVERFEEVWRLTLARARGDIGPVTAVYDCRMLNFWRTSSEPMSGFVARMKAIEAEPGILSVNFGHGFPYGDVPEAGAKVWVIADGDAAAAARWAETLGQELWAMRERTRARATTLNDALDALEVPRTKPVVLADIADNPGGGASSDSTFILRGLIERGIGDAAFAAFWDLGAIRICQEAGVGARVTLRLGGKCGPASGDPIDLPVTVKALKDDHQQNVLGIGFASCGPSVWVRTEDGIDIVLTTARTQPYGSDIFTGIGVELSDKRCIVVKSTQHFYAAFAAMASEVLYVDTPGLLRSDFENFVFQRRDMNVWPCVDNPWADHDGG